MSSHVGLSAAKFCSRAATPKMRPPTFDLRFYASSSSCCCARALSMGVHQYVSSLCHPLSTAGGGRRLNLEGELGREVFLHMVCCNVNVIESQRAHFTYYFPWVDYLIDC